MAIKPILFNTEMSRAILDGRKTTMRRVVKYDRGLIYKAACGAGKWIETYTDVLTHLVDWYATRKAKTPCVAGDVLWVRETWAKLARVDENCCTHYDECEFYYATDGDYQIDIYDDGGFLLNDQRIKWHPSIHMPKAAARTFLRVTGVRVERLQDITDDACRDEGIREWTKDGNLYKYYPADCEGDAPACEWQKCPRSLKGAMQMLWDSTIKKADLQRYGWNANPWVWVIEFERCERPEGFV